MTSSPTPNPADAMVAFWKDAWARMGAPAPGASAAQPGAASGFPGMSGMSGMPGGPNNMDPLGWMPTPEMMRRMQSAFMDAMASSAEQYMRSPQFLESMKQSLDSATQMRRQIEETLRRNVGDAFKTPGQSGGDVVAALHEMEARLAAALTAATDAVNARFDDLGARLDRVESASDEQTKRAVRSK